MTLSRYYVAALYTGVALESEAPTTLTLNFVSIDGSSVNHVRRIDDATALSLRDAFKWAERVGGIVVQRKMDHRWRKRRSLPGSDRQRVACTLCGMSIDRFTNQPCAMHFKIVRSLRERGTQA